MTFESVFTIGIWHDYFQGQQNEALTIEPTSACADFCRKRGLFFRKTGPARFSVFSTIPVKSGNNGNFEFFLFIDDKDFLQYTQAPETKADEIILFSNGASTNKKPEELVPAVVPKPPMHLTTNRPLFGMIRISTHSVPAHFKLTLKAAGIKWKYYLIAGRNQTDLSIEDKSSDIVFTKKNMAKAAEQKDPVSEAIIKSFPDASLFLFESNVAIPCQETGRKNIQLISNKNVVLINHLPNPALKENGIKIINTIT